jgi:hypothetical protein lmonocFSL_04052
MNRQILFRAKCFGRWRYGSYVHFDKKPTHNCYNCNYKDFIVTNEEDGEHYYPITELSSIGQYTGLKDKNGKKIFEGDIVEFTNLDLPNMVIRFDNGSFMFCEDENSTYEELRMTYTVEVVGNIYDTPELMK